jgi:hypothetical protein
LICTENRLYSGRVKDKCVRGSAIVAEYSRVRLMEEHNVKETLWRCTFARVMALAVAVALIPLPVLAGENPTPPKSGKNLTAAIASAASREAIAATRASAVSATAAQGDAKNPDLGTWGFFKTPLGIGVAVLLAAGTGYAVYSWKHDRIVGPGRSGGLK